MAAVSVTANVTRVDDAENGTGWASIGGGQGGASEGSFPYQGTNLFNRKVTSSSGFYYDPTGDGGSAVDMTATATRTWLVKAIVTDYGGLQPANGLVIRIGSGTNAYYEYTIAGTDSPVNAYDNYPPVGGLIIVPIDPNIAGYRSGTSGSPALTATDYFGLVGNFASSTAKSENVGLDAIDIGTGLTLTGGDGASADGVYADFVAADQGTVNNRWGFASALEGGAVIKAFGKLAIGSGTATEFNDVDASILWPDHFAAAGFSGIAVDLSNVLTTVIDGSVQTGLGSTAIADSRPDYVVTGIAGSANLSHTLNNFRNYTLTSACTVTGADVQAASITPNSAVITSSTLRTRSLAGSASLVQPNLTNISDVTFKQTGTGHAIEITTPGVYAFNSLFFDDYSITNGTNDAAIYNNSGGSVSINIVGGDVPTFRNGAGASTSIISSTSLTLTGIENNSEVTIVRDSDDVELFHEENVTTGNSQYSYDTADGGVAVTILVMNVADFEPLSISTTLPLTTTEIPIQQTPERNFSNP